MGFQSANLDKRFGVSTTVKVLIAVFWVVAPCGGVSVFRGTDLPPSSGNKMKASWVDVLICPPVYPHLSLMRLLKGFL
jgi:hypothetical protein